MKKIRTGVFETNSSSTHSLTYYGDKENYNFLAPNSKLLIEFIDTDDWNCLSTLQEKVSYLVSQIINKYKYQAVDYEDLIHEVSNDWGFIRVKDFVKKKYGKEIVFPKSYKGTLEDIVLINHQLVDWHDFNDLLKDIYCYDHDLLEDILANNTVIELDRD